MLAYKKIAIVGSGISGLTAAYLLNKKYEITVFEKGAYVGGHTNTVSVTETNRELAVDTGFIVFNEETYPNFIKLLKKINVPKQKSTMSFSFSSAVNSLEYSGESLNSLFCDRRNLFRKDFYKFLFDIQRFNIKAKKFLGQSQANMTLSQFLEKQRYSDSFKECYLEPLASAIWSMPAKSITEIPAQFMFEFYSNHGLLNQIKRPQWYVIKGGSREYVKKMTVSFRQKIQLNSQVIAIKRTAEGVTIKTQTGEHDFDAVVIACHSDQALSLLQKPSEAECEILSNIPYKKNTATLHTDICGLPSNRRAWASWNYMQGADKRSTLTYYMNKLQSIRSQNHYCVSINNPNIDQNKIIKTIHYSHPVYNSKSIEAKNNHNKINGKNNTYYVGAYWGNGFHEDGVRSSINALCSLGVEL